MDETNGCPRSSQMGEVAYMIAFVDDFPFNYLFNYLVFIFVIAIPSTLLFKVAGPFLLKWACRLTLRVLDASSPLARVLRDRLVSPARRSRRSRSLEQLVAIKRWVLLDRHHLVDTCGKEGFQMIVFERFVLLLQAVGLVFCAVAVIVNHFVGEDRAFSFSGTTMGNLNFRTKSQFAIVHVVLAAAMIPITALLVNLFFLYIWDESPLDNVRKTLFLYNLKRHMRNEEFILLYFEKNYPWVHVLSIFFNKRIRNIDSLEEEYQLVLDVIRQVSEGSPETEKTTRSCYDRLSFSSSEMEVLAKDFYQQKKKSIESEIQETIGSMSYPTSAFLDSAFVQVDSLAGADSVVFFHKNRLGRRSVKMNFAPEYEDIRWGSIQHTKKRRFTNFAMDALSILIFSGFLSVELFELAFKKVHRPTSLHNVFIRYPYLRSIYSVIIGENWNFVAEKIQDYGYWTDSRKSRSFLLRNYLGLFIMLYLLPLLNITSIAEVIDQAIQGKRDLISLDCIISPDNGFLYLNNIMIMTIKELLLEILRVHKLYDLAKALVFHNSWSELKVQIDRLKVTTYFPDQSLSKFLLNHTVCMAFSVISPVVSLAGFVYAMIQHTIDSYRFMSGQYKAVKVESRQFYLVGTDILLFACLVQQFSVFACLVSCKGSTDDIFDHEVAVVAVTSIIVSLVFVTIQCHSKQRWPVHINPHGFRLQDLQENLAPHEPDYQPSVLKVHDQ